MAKSITLKNETGDMDSVIETKDQEQAALCVLGGEHSFYIGNGCSDFDTDGGIEFLHARSKTTHRLTEQEMNTLIAELKK